MTKISLLVATFCLFAASTKALTLAEALDATNLVWTSGGQAPWSAEAAIFNHDGFDSGESGTLPDDSESWVQTQLTGPGILSFFWKVSSEAESDFLQFHLNGQLQESISGEIDWTPRVVVLPAGTHTARWRYVKDLIGSGLFDAAWIDEVTFVPAVGLAESLDIPWAALSGGGQVGWIGQTNVSHEGGDAAQSGPISHSQLSWMEVTTQGPLNLNFWWKVSSEQNFDFLEFFVGGIFKKRISGEVDWTMETFQLGSGRQTLRWQYIKDISASAGQDRGWVDAPNLPEPIIVRGILQPNGAFLLQITGLKANLPYQLEVSSNLLQWHPFNGITNVTQAFIEDASASLVPARFYRVSSP